MISIDRTDSLQFDLAPGISLKAHENMFVRVQSASISIVQCNVNSTNNKLVLFYGASLTLTATIQIGNYTSGTDLATAMNATTGFGTSGLTVSYSKFSNKLTFSHSQSASITIVTATLTMQLIGMNELNNLIVPTGVATTTPRMLDLSGVRSVIIACESFELDCMDSLKTVGESTTNLLLYIPQSVAYGDILTYKTDSSPFMSARRRNLSTILIQLLDENQNPYDTQGLPWSCVIDVELHESLIKNLAQSHYIAQSSMQCGRFLGRVAGFGAWALPAVQRFGNTVGEYLHKGSMIGARVAKVARSGLDEIERSDLGRVPGVGELIGVGRDATNVLDMASRAAGRAGDVASRVEQSK
ncbi:hypothetical protein T492DRAFT_844221 [Pavlovales sp. CCMP2436]|nr:hypothetical protein T492DRAFT_844221 [Pavlovales sp. CCMP2436]